METRLQRIQRLQAENKGNNPLYELMALVIMLGFLGFPGRLTRLIGESMATLFDYGCFFLQIVLCLISSGDDYLSVRLLNLKKRYEIVYLYLAFIIVTGILISTEKKEEIITCLRLVTTASFGFWLSEHYDPEQFLEFFYRASVLMLGAILLYFVRYPGSAYGYYEGQRAFLGVYTTKNEAGIQMGFCVMEMLLLLRFKRESGQRLSRLFYVTLFVYSVLLVLTKATGALICVILPIAYIMVFEKRWGPERRLSMGVLFPIVQVGFLFFALTVIPMFEPLLNAIGKDATLTGRIPMWNAHIALMMEHRTMLGWGYQRYWKNAEAMKLYHAFFERNSWSSSMTTGCHNLTLELWTNTGLVGVALFFFMLYKGLKNMKRLPEKEYLFCSSMMMMFMLYCLAERAMAPAAFFTLFLFIVIGYCSGAEQSKKEQE